MKTTPATKAKILEISITLFAKNGFAETSIRDIAKEANIKSSSIYYYFASKDEILYEILNMGRHLFMSLKNWDTFKSNLAERQEPITSREIINLLFYTFEESEAEIGLNMLKIIFMEASRDETVKEFFTNQYLVYAYKNVLDVLEYLNNTKHIHLSNVHVTSSTLFAIALSFVNLSFFGVNRIDPQEMRSSMFCLMENALDLERNKE